jgi:rhodanese-related sulfurtransferase
MSKLSPKDAIIKAAKGEITVIDVREAAEIAATGKAAGALHIPLALLGMRADPKGGSYEPAIKQGKPVAVYCAAGARAGRAAQTLTALGYDAHNIGGFGDWAAAGGPVTR